MSRAILIDTETTGLDPGLGHRVIELAAIELVNDLPSGRHFHALIDPEREVDPDAAVVHGFTTAMLRGKPRFAEIAPALVDFLGEATLIAHNAGFDATFLNAELARVPLPPLDLRPLRRHAGAGQDAVSRRSQQPRCALPTLRDRPLGAHHA